MDADDTQAKSTLVTLQDGREKKEFKTKTPPLDWAFNILLVKIDNGMTSKELEEVKTFFKGLYKDVQFRLWILHYLL